ncbi:rho guanine nucleotide exchange factor 39-like [Anneissia japonica]|uniref:rho guanine nucleotide exchange factor 39-like n=1 Tax=Anneissia japonica TaxID=1529436 RepID=UPI0014255D08|nr:rho guanine nucleotide exchange factor 39-like [Anneissia japonica]
MSQQTPKAAFQRRSLRSPRSTGRTPRSAKKTPTTPDSTRSRKGLRSSRKKICTPGSSGIQTRIDAMLQDQQGSIRKRNIKREKVVNEIFDSEKKYQQQLCAIIQCFYNPVRKNGILPEDAISTIFSNITAIKAVNQELLIHLETYSVGKAFLLLAPSLRLYSTYANSFDKASTTLEEWTRRSKEFAEFKLLQESKTTCHSLKLHALLITPIQRIPRYKLLLEELLEKTSQSHEDYAQLKEAAKRVSDVAHSINKQLKEHDNFQKMLSIQNCMVGDGAPRILSPGRRFIKEGALKKVSKKGNKSHDRMFFLFSDIMVYAKPTFLENTDSATSFTCRCIINLLDCSVECVLGDHKVPGAGALFKLSFGNDCLLLFHEDQNIALSWIEAIKGTISLLKRNSASLMKTASTAALSPMIKRSRVRTSLRIHGKRKRPDGESDPPTFQDSLYPMRKYLQSLKFNSTRETPSKRCRLAKNQCEQKQSKMNETKFTEADSIYKTPKKTFEETTFFTPSTSMVNDTSRDQMFHTSRQSKTLSSRKPRPRHRAPRNMQSTETNNDTFCTIL